jgi:branched-chain amino acid transport system permease protein
MSLILVLQVILNGIIQGLVYALCAAGFSLIYGQANILFFTLGEIYMLGAVLTWVFTSLFGLPFFVSIALSFIMVGLFGIVLERYLFRLLIGKVSPLIVAFASYVLGMLIVGFTMETFGERAQAIPHPFRGKLDIFGVILTVDKLAVVLMAVAIVLGLQLFFKFAKAGQAIRAVAQDEDAAQLVGVNINRSKALTFFLALGVAAVAGGLVTPLSYVESNIGMPVLMTTLIVVVLGGLGSFSGAIVGGLFIGLLESFGYTFLGGISTILSFLVVIVVLIFRPQGLLGRV